jgi:hypothetical protein
MQLVHSFYKPGACLAVGKPWQEMHNDIPYSQMLTAVTYGWHCKQTGYASVGPVAGPASSACVQ